ncbi:hypothetical protein JTE90_015508 [Oedothorax gibbosus]|uniref:Methyltransferase type 11 domain-containing protein n=1 Tax=Oedothorax gibbosus TaxID=931172 RepID=A0AAV6VRJ0_9ARAC|nr:hypothetical protein JTE90_015508 [Oedothorax gibbosus]
MGDHPQQDDERQARSLALEKAYVHDVYDHFSGGGAPPVDAPRYRPWPRVRHFLMELEPGSLVADVGCGSGKYLDINPDLMKIGCDRCAPLVVQARSKGEVLRCDNLRLPFRDDTFDAVLSVAVVHHFATTDRRVAAIREITRVLRIGGKVLITVWAMEQRHRKFDSQDVLVPWHQPVKSSSEDHASSAAEREVTSTTSDDDILVYHAYSHVSDHEKGQQQQGQSIKKRQKYRNGRGRYRSADSAVHCRKTAGTSSQSSSELSSPNETCYSFVRRAFQKLSNSTSPTSPSDTFGKKSRQYFYKSCRKPTVSESMEFGKYNGRMSPRNEFGHQDSIESEYPDQPTTDDDIPIELRHLEGYETCKKCGSPSVEFSGFGNCESQVCTSCLPADPEPCGKKSRSLGDFLNMIPKLLRVKKYEKEPLSDLHKRISTASDPREYVVKTRGSDVNGIVRSKSTVSMMSRLEELMAMSQLSDKEESVANPNCSAGPRSKSKPSMFQSFPSATTLFESVNGTVEIQNDEIVKTNLTARRYNSPADALQKLRQDVSLDEPFNIAEAVKESNEEKNNDEKEDDVMSPTLERKMQNSELLTRRRRSSIKQASSLTETKHPPESKGDTSPSDGSDNKGRRSERSSEGRLTSYYSMPELYKSTLEEELTEKPEMNLQKERHISFYEQAQNIFSDNSTDSPNDLSRRHESTLSYAVRERSNIGQYQRGFVKRSLSVDTGDNCLSRRVPRRFSASAAQGVLASALRTYSMPRSCSRGSSVKSDTSVDSEESIVSVIPRKGNSITSDTSVDSEESVVSVIQRSTSEFETLGSQNGLRNNISRFGSRSAQASPVTVLSSQTSSAESSPPQSGKTDGKFPGSSGVIDQLLQQQQLLHNPSEGTHSELCYRTKRCLLRPISDPKIEEKLSSSNNFEDLTSNPGTRQSTVGFPRSNQGSLELTEEFKTSIKEYSTLSKVSFSQNGITKHSVADMALNWKSETISSQEGDLSRTPSPVGPFQYITDPLITGIENKEISDETDLKENSTKTTDTKSKSIRFNTEIMNFEVSKGLSVSEILRPPNGIIDLVLKKSNLKSDENKTLKDSKSNSSSFDDSNEASCSNDIPSTSKNETLVKSDSASSDDSTKSKKENDMRKSFFKLRERLENLASSQSSSLDIFKNVGHSFGSLKNIKEKMDSDSSNDSYKDNKVSSSPKSLNDSRQSSLDESSQVTYSDESVMSVEGTSSVSDENDYKKTDEEDDNAESSQNITVKNVEECQTAASPSQNGFSEGVHQKNFQMKKIETCTGKCGSEHYRPSKASSFSDTELHVKKGGARCALRKRLRRSCVTIDEVECREFVSSEDTSPSSSLSLEWNDFDKIDTDSSSYVGGCKGITTIPEDDICGGEASVEARCDDVNVTETETKFNIVDKEMCVFFETPSSSIGKSASSSSNATDFSTTSDRFRGIMQREKSDDRSSKESDSDNLSKLSDVEARSDSAFSEDFARRCDLASSSSSASMDALDSVRVKLSNDTECDDASGCSKQISNWVLDDIDEIPDDEKNHDEKGQYEGEKSPAASISTDWKPDKSMDFAQRKENFFSSAADCRDMYRISFDSKLKSDRNGFDNKSESDRNGFDNKSYIDRRSKIERNSFDRRFKDDRNNRRDIEQAQHNIESNTGSRDLVPMGMIMPDLAPNFLELFPPARRLQDENEAPTDILAAFVETISDITSAFGELYPRKESKVEEASSDDSISVGISTFERILTSSVATHSKNRPRKSLDHQKETPGNEDFAEKVRNSDGNAQTEDNNAKSIKSDLQTIGQTFVKLPPEDDPSLNSTHAKDSETNPKPPTKDSDSSLSETPKSERKLPGKLKILNRTTQSVCLDRVRQNSFDKDDEQSAQSTPCSPRMKPRQRSVEEVMSSSRNELSRNSSLSQSTSQESLPGNDSGGMMSYHRYYHVFRQGELDSLIENHVDNLHILSSYYDHANWCIVAEKVQVWTI